MVRHYVEIYGFTAFILYGVAILLNNVMLVMTPSNPLLYVYIAIACTGLAIVLATIALLILMYRTCRSETLIETSSLLYTDGDHQMVN